MYVNVMINAPSWAGNGDILVTKGMRRECGGTGETGGH